MTAFIGHSDLQIRDANFISLILALLFLGVCVCIESMVIIQMEMSCVNFKKFTEQITEIAGDVVQVRDFFLLLFMFY